MSQSNYVSRRANPKAWRADKRAAAETQHARKVAAIKPQAFHAFMALLAETWINGTRVEITAGAFRDRQGVITRQHFAGFYVLLDMKPAEFSIKEPLIIADASDNKHPVKELPPKTSEA